MSISTLVILTKDDVIKYTKDIFSLTFYTATDLLYDNPKL